MPPSRIAVFPGSFDPLTNGHVDLIRRSTRLFDRVIVAVAVNPGKQPLFTLEERMAMIREACAGIAPPSRLEADAFEGLLVHYVTRQGACAVIRGLRGGADFDYERPMTAMNAHLAPDIETVCLMAASQYAHISSRLVKEVALLGGRIDGLVPDMVAPRVLARLKSAAQTRP
jgi:pantetheine-phosphate adenylyltransferase